MVKKWFKPKRESGFDKDYTIDKNLRAMYRNSDKRLTPAHRWRQVGRQAQALANVTTDAPTRKKAQAVAIAAFKKV